MDNSFSYSPLSQLQRTVILDTDIGPDCDDAGAIACLLFWQERYHFSVAAGTADRADGRKNTAVHQARGDPHRRGLDETIHPRSAQNNFAAGSILRAGASDDGA